MSRGINQPVADEWITFPGGELEGRRPKVLCPTCRERFRTLPDDEGHIRRRSVLNTREGSGPSASASGAPSAAAALGCLSGGGAPREVNKAKPLCFQCYRTELDRQRALKAAGELDTASDERFQTALPFEPVNRPRLDMLKAERGVSRDAMAQGGRFADKRRQAQINARHALQRIASGLKAQPVAQHGNVEADRAWASAVHAAELQLPESWLPFVVSR